MIRRRVLRVLLVTLLALGLGGWWLHEATPPLALGPGVVPVRQAQGLPPFRLEGTHGVFSNAELLGHWTFLLFGYTHCPDVCPTDLALLNRVVRDLAQQEPKNLQVVFVSVDPQRDSLALLGRYVPAFNPAFVGATGSDQALQALTKPLGAYYVRNEQEGPGYSVDHSSAVYLIDPQGRPQASFQMPQTPQQMVRDTRSLMRVGG